MMENNVYKNYSTRDKASEINHNSSIYGTFAEIGAGQEVAASFFKAGHASGTIAKTMSAYDMTFSDAIYGPANRYVSRKRLECMLSKEYHLLTRRLTTRRKRSTFFAFANTVKTGQGDTPGEGWVGVRFQLHANSEPNECIIHVVMKDKDIRGATRGLGDHWREFIVRLLLPQPSSRCDDTLFDRQCAKKAD